MLYQKLFINFIALLTLVTINSLNAATLFTANLDGSQVAPPLGPTSSLSTGTATLTLDISTPGDPKLAYTLQLEGLDLGADPTDPADDNDVTAIHIHRGEPGTNGPHSLNIFGIAGGTLRMDDSDVSVDADAGTVSGIWDNSDELFTGDGNTKQPFDSLGLSDALSDLEDGNLYFQLHSLGFPDGEIRGQIIAVPDSSPIPEPSTVAFFALGIGMLGIKLRKVKP